MANHERAHGYCRGANRWMKRKRRPHRELSHARAGNSHPHATMKNNANPFSESTPTEIRFDPKTQTAHAGELVLGRHGASNVLTRQRRRRPRGRRGFCHDARQLLAEARRAALYRPFGRRFRLRLAADYRPIFDPRRARSDARLAKSGLNTA